MNFLVEGLPVHAHGNPSEGVDSVEDTEGELPVHHEWVDEEEVPGEGHQGHLSAVRILEVDGTVLHVVAAPQKQFSFTVEFQCLRWLVHLICSFQVLSRSLGQLSLSCIHYLVQVVHLTE